MKTDCSGASGQYLSVGADTVQVLPELQAVGVCHHNPSTASVCLGCKNGGYPNEKGNFDGENDDEPW